MDPVAMLEDAERLVVWSDRADLIDRELLAVSAERATSAHESARASEAHDVVEVLAEEFRRQHFPRAGRAVVALGQVYVISKRGFRSRRVFGADYPRVDRTPTEQRHLRSA